MAEWNGKYIHPYAEHGKKSEQVKKVTVSIPINVLNVKHSFMPSLVSRYRMMKI